MSDAHSSEGGIANVARAAEDFNRLRIRQILRSFFSPFKSRRDRLLSLSEVRRILKPTSEAYRGTRSVPVRLIVGSEGRYNDFTRTFLPRHAKLRARWMRVNSAYQRNINLPLIQLYELGGAYFIRDGNHRVSVAVQQGVEYIDAEVTSLNTYFRINPAMTAREMEAAVVEYERERFLSETHIEDLVPHFEMYFTSPGQYDTVLSHILNRREELKRGLNTNASLSEAITSWYADVYEPVVRVIREKSMLAAFPGRTVSDLYVWVMNHWELLCRKYGKNLPVTEAADSFGKDHKGYLFAWLLLSLARRMERPRKRRITDVGINAPPRSTGMP
jgi:hypothetical protein